MFTTCFLVTGDIQLKPSYAVTFNFLPFLKSLSISTHKREAFEAKRFST